MGGSLTVSDSTIAGGASAGVGKASYGISNVGGAVNLTNCTVRGGDNAQGNGGIALYYQSEYGRHQGRRLHRCGQRRQYRGRRRCGQGRRRLPVRVAGGAAILSSRIASSPAAMALPKPGPRCATATRTSA
ncbi:MAG: hypothetical protein ACLSVD_04105 [Eggerthellaceae bacterium]